MVFFHSVLNEELTRTSTRNTGRVGEGGHMSDHGFSEHWPKQELWGPILEMRRLREDQTGEVACLGAHPTAL